MQVGDGFIGYEDDIYYYLIPSISHKLVKKLCDEQGELFSISERTLLKHLDDDGFIETSKNYYVFVVIHKDLYG